MGCTFALGGVHKLVDKILPIIDPYLPPVYIFLLCILLTFPVHTYLLFINEVKESHVLPELKRSLVSPSLSSVRKKNMTLKRNNLAIKKSLRSIRNDYKEVNKEHKMKDTKRIYPNTFSNLREKQNDKDSISIEEDNDIALIVNELLNELYN